LALPTDPAETFVREVDENLRRDQLRDTAQRYGKWIVAGVILFLAAIGGYLYWQHRLDQQAIADSEAMSAALDKVGAGNVKGAEADLVPLSDSSNDVTRATALLGRATLAVQQSDRKTASALFNQVADDDGLPQPFRDLATVRATMVDYDSLKPEEVIARLKPLLEDPAVLKVAQNGLLDNVLTTLTSLLGISSGATFRDTGTLIDRIYDRSGIRLLGLLDLDLLFRDADGPDAGVLNLLGTSNPLGSTVTRSVSKPSIPASARSCWITISVIAYSPSPKWWYRIRPSTSAM